MLVCGVVVHDQVDFESIGHVSIDLPEKLAELLRSMASELLSYHVACHQRVQKIGLKTKELLTLIEGTEISVIERCSGHDGTYTFKKEFHDTAMKICKPVVNRVKIGCH